MKHIKFCLIISLLGILFPACNKTLDKTPQDKYSDAVLWSDIGLANAYLLDTYRGTQIGFRQVMLSTVTDEAHSTHDKGAPNYVEGLISAEDTNPWIGNSTNFPFWTNYFLNIQKLNVFISKMDAFADSYPEDQKLSIKKKSAIMKGEALFLRAFCYTQLARTYGGVPILKEPNKLGDDFKKIGRTSFEDLTKFITDDCDASAALLDGQAMALGRATKGAALALKSRMLLFAASDLTAGGTAANKFVGYENPNRNELWKAAKDAAKAVINMGVYQLANFGAPDKAAVSQNYFNFFKAKDLSNKEVIWGKMYVNADGDVNRMNLWNEGNGWASAYGSDAPLQNLVDAYEMEDGSGFFDHFKIDGQGFYKNISSKYQNKNPYYSRDPRFYGSILYDGALWRPRSASVQSIDPLGAYSRRTIISIINGVKTTDFGLDSRQTTLSSSFNGSYTGYVMKKMLDNAIDWSVQNNENIWIEFRYAEIILNYAEACLESGALGEAASYINKIRNRAGMPDFTGDITQALRYERRIELTFENNRWYDIRRWKILNEALSDAKGMDITETNVDGVISTTWQNITIEKRVFEPKMYWIPISADELNRAPGLEQNPGY